MPPGALDGLLVADFSRVLAGPLAAMVLGDLGADVVKVERPDGGDDTRSWGASYFLALNRNKRSVTLDLADPADRALARELALRADVLVESFRPGLMEDWGLGLERLRADNPRLVTCSVSAFGPQRRAAGLRPARPGDGRLDVGHRRGRRAAAEGRRAAGRRDLRAPRGDRDPRRAGLGAPASTSRSR